MPWSVVLVALGLLLLAPPDAGGAQDVLKQARSAPTRADSLQILEGHLASSPRDVDARLLYGIMLSWEARYDDARRELLRVLAESPDYFDARVALMNVEWWSGRVDEARALSTAILWRDPRQPQARLVRDRTVVLPWAAGATVVADAFSDDRRGWQEQLISISRQTPAGAVVVRGSRADRFGLDDEQIEVEFYPVFGPSTYAFIGAGVANDRVLYPKHRFAFDVYRTLGGGVEASAGYRRLGFARPANVYVGTLSKYLAAWLLTGKVFYAEARGAAGQTSVHLQARRYFDEDGSSFAGAGYGRGLSREEIRGAGDLERDPSDTLRAELDVRASTRLRVQVSARTSRERPASGLSFWQHTMSGGLLVRF